MAHRKISFSGLVALGLAIAFSSPATAEDQLDPVATVKLFNSAVTARDMDTAMATLAEGSVQIQLRAVHPGMSDDPPLTGDLTKTWQMVAAIVFPMSEAYSRTVEITSSTEDGDVATVWANTTTRTDRKDKSEPMVLQFSEVYLLVKKSGQWRIAAVADNRQPDNVPVAPQT
jgi:ketosteroid isomerase-like protein